MADTSRNTKRTVFQKQKLVPLINLILEAAVVILLLNMEKPFRENPALAHNFLLWLSLGYLVASVSWIYVMSMRIVGIFTETLLRISQGAIFLCVTFWYLATNGEERCYSHSISEKSLCSITTIAGSLGIFNTLLYLFTPFFSASEKDDDDGFSSRYNLEVCVMPRNYKVSSSAHNRIPSPPPYEAPPKYETVIHDKEAWNEKVINHTNKEDCSSA